MMRFREERVGPVPVQIVQFSPDERSRCQLVQRSPGGVRSEACPGRVQKKSRSCPESRGGVQDVQVVSRMSCLAAQLEESSDSARLEVEWVTGRSSGVLVVHGDNVLLPSC